MVSIRAVAVAFTVIALGAQPFAAADLSRYREYALASSVAAIARTSAARESDLKTLHTRPAKIQTLEWRAPYVPSGKTDADPVRDLQFSFYDDQLFQIVVTYDRERMAGLTNDDVIGSLATTYGAPVLPVARGARGAALVAEPSDLAVLARWEDAASLLTLTRSTYSKQFQLVLVSKALNTRALGAMKEALRLDAQDAPQRALDLSRREAADASSADEQARGVNKPAFRP